MKYKSNKNTVELIDGKIYKTFTDDIACDVEENALLFMNGNLSPRLISRKNNTLCIQYIQGNLLIDEFCEADENKSVFLAKLLSDTIIQIYTVTNKITYDENFRNYIVTETSIFRIDFEELTEGTLILWAAKILSFAALYDVNENIKFLFSKTLLACLNIDSSTFLPIFKNELEFLSARWQVKFPSDYFDKISDI